MLNLSNLTYTFPRFSILPVHHYTNLMQFYNPCELGMSILCNEMCKASIV